MNYGGRGIVFCNEWLTFIPFMEWALSHGYEDHLTLERVDVNGNYEPSNCKWITMQEQHYNKRNNRFFEYNGEKKTVAQWAITIGVSRQTLRYRLEAGWNIADLVSGCDQGKRRTGYVPIRDRLLDINGIEKTILKWSKEIGISCRALNDRVNKYGWTDGHLLLPSGSKKPV